MSRKSFAIKVGVAAVAAAMFTAAGAVDSAHANRQDRNEFRFMPNALVVSRVEYEGNSFGSTDIYPYIFNDPSVSGVQGCIFLDQYAPLEHPHLMGTLALPCGSDGITTSFSSKSEGALARSVDGRWLAYMGYEGPVGAEGVSNSETPGATLTTNTDPTYNREVALIGEGGSISLTPETNAYSGDNPRAVITVDGTQFYMAGNADSSLNKDGTGPGTTIGARLGMPGSDQSIQLGVYTATDRTDESAKKHIKDNNFRGVGIFDGDLFVSKGSGGNGDNGVFQVHNGGGEGLPTGTGNTITQLLGGPATLTDGSSSPYTPFGFFFADQNTLYVADEGNIALDATGNLLPTPDPLAGLEKWSYVNGAWQLDYTLQDGLNLNQFQNVDGYPVPTATVGLRNLTGVVNCNGTVTLYAITAQYSSISGGEPDPTSLVTITDRLAATTLPSGKIGPAREKFETLAVSGPGEVFRGVAFAPGAHR
jgi:hypothetical protein